MLRIMKSPFGILWNALLTAIVVTLLAGLFVAAMPPVYRATATVQGSSEDMLRLRSADFLERALKSSKIGTQDLVGWLEEITSARLEGVQLLQQKLFVSAGDQPGWIDITVEAQNAETATRFANDIARLHSEMMTRVQLTAEEKARLLQEVEAVDERLAKFLDENPEVLRFKQAQQQLGTEVKRLENQKLRIENQQALDREQLQAVRGDAVGALTEPGVVRAASRLQAYETKRAELASRYGDQHQKMLAVNSELLLARTHLEEELAAYGRRLEQRIMDNEAKTRELQNRIDEFEQKIERLDLSVVEYEKLGTARNTALARYEGMSDSEPSKVFSRAVVPGNALGFNQALLLVVVFLASFMFMAILMVIRAGRVESTPGGSA